MLFILYQERIERIQVALRGQRQWSKERVQGRSIELVLVQIFETYLIVCQSSAASAHKVLGQ